MALMDEAGNYPEEDRCARVLVAEDSSITQDLLKLVLTQRGHTVDIVNDGREALEALLDTAYDVALLDFHMPVMDGLEVVSAFLSQATGSLRPRFVAITADVEGLLAHRENCERFDEVVPKPVDIEEICRVIDDCMQDREAGLAPAGPDSGGKARPARADGAGDTGELGDEALFAELGYAFLRWPDDFDAGHLTARGMRATLPGASFDAVLVTRRATVSDLAVLWKTRSLHVLPVIDLAGGLGRAADFDGTGPARERIEKVRTLVEGFLDRRERLHRDLLATDDLGERLLGRIFVSGQALSPFYEACDPSLVGYSTVLASRLVATEAQKLASAGFLSPTFFDRVHQCPGCDASQFNIREECPACRSADLVEEAYLHHYKCAYQGPESDFHVGDELVCPKCRQTLAFFGSDYDKPGTMIQCHSCGHATSEPAVGFVCLRCGHHADGDAVRAHDVYGYELTDKARDFLEAGNAYLGFTQKTLRFAELPLDLVVALNEGARLFNDAGTPFALLDIAYGNEREIEREHGPRQFAQIRTMFLENLASLLPDEAKVVKGQSYDFALLRATDPATLRRSVADLCARSSSALRLDPGATITVFGPEDLV